MLVSWTPDIFELRTNLSDPQRLNAFGLYLMIDLLDSGQGRVLLTFQLKNLQN